MEVKWGWLSHCDSFWFLSCKLKLLIFNVNKSHADSPHTRLLQTNRTISTSHVNIKKWFCWKWLNKRILLLWCSSNHSIILIKTHFFLDYCCFSSSERQNVTKVPTTLKLFGLIRGIISEQPTLLLNYLLNLIFISFLLQ